ncbi:hypothetical protein ACH4Y0_02585 [Streptomyces sp. NPDC020707]
MVERYGVSWLDLAAPPTGPSEEDIDGPGDAQTWVLEMAIDNAAARF